MGIKSIEITNFKCVGTRQTLNLRPITLLFGQNNSGKSTILHAMQYMREILVRDNLNADYTIGGGELDLGGFESLVHNHELDRSITIKINAEISDKLRNLYLPLNAGETIYNDVFDELSVTYLAGGYENNESEHLVKEVGIELEISWSHINQRPFVARVSADMNGKPIVTISSKPEEMVTQSTTEKSGISKFKIENTAHPLLNFATSPINGESSENIDILSPVLTMIVNMADIPWEEIKNEHVSFSFDLHSPVLLSDTRQELSIELVDPEFNTSDPLKSTRLFGLNKLLSEFIFGPIGIVRHFLLMSTFIGPLRKIPARNFRAQNSSDESRWANGLGAWDLIHNDIEGSLTRNVNEWISGKEKLGISFAIERTKTKEIPTKSESEATMSNLPQKSDSEMEIEKSNNLSFRDKISLRHVTKGIRLEFSDLGVGISQLLPIVITALCKKFEILAIEQPELHIHPELQVKMGDLFIWVTKREPNSFEDKKSLIIETHSEQIILRLLRRVRETNDGSLPEGQTELIPDDLSVYYVESKDKEVKFHPLRVDVDGDFLDQWPEGFFEERISELF